MTARTRARLQLVVAAMLFSTGGAAIKAAAFSGVQVASLRSGIAAVAVLLMIPAARRGWSWRTLVVGAAYAATLVLFVLANRLTTSANTIFLQSTGPLYLVVLGPLLLHERVRRQDLALMGVVAIGLVLFFVGAERPVGTAPDPARGNLLAAASGLTWALTLLGLRWLSDAERSAGHTDANPSIAAVAAGNLIACLACLPWALPLGAHGVADWAIVGYLGVFQIAVAYLFVTAGLRHVPAFEASVLLLVEPALNPIWSWLVHGEVPGAWAIVGGVLILGATVVKTWLDARLAPLAPAAVADGA
ncbi:MAG TPA: DMT family transporter [Gemmatimonadales bacterium]|nr:DMT family transporter [Gemmatimonadales bacterium]